MQTGAIDMAEVHGNRKIASNAGNNAHSVGGDAKSDACGAQMAQFGSDLRFVIESWPSLPKVIKGRIVSMIQAIN